MERVINTKRGLYGRVNITLPLPIKNSMMDFQKRSGLKKAEFLRLALTTGFLDISKSNLINKVEDGGAAQQPART
jgi:hypothetical protein